MLLLLLLLQPVLSGRAVAAETRERELLVGYQFLAVPVSFMDGAFEKAQPLYLQGAFARLGVPVSASTNLELGAGFARFLGRDGFWLPRGTNRDGATWVRPRAAVAAVTVGLGKRWQVLRTLALRFGAETGAAYFLGDIDTHEVVPGCEGPLDGCGHWKKSWPLGIKNSILPLLGLYGAIEYMPFERLGVQLEGGFRDTPYASVLLSVRPWEKE